MLKVGKLKGGQQFIYEGERYLKINMTEELQGELDSDYTFVVKIRTGDFTYLRNSEEVIEVN